VGQVGEWQGRGVLQPAGLYAISPSTTAAGVASIHPASQLHNKWATRVLRQPLSIDDDIIISVGLCTATNFVVFGLSFQQLST